MADQVATPLPTSGMEAFKMIESMTGLAMPNGFVINAVLGWLDASDDTMNKVDMVRIMSRSFTELEIDVAKKVYMDLVNHHSTVD